MPEKKCSPISFIDSIHCAEDLKHDLQCRIYNVQSYTYMYVCPVFETCHIYSVCVSVSDFSKLWKCICLIQCIEINKYLQ